MNDMTMKDLAKAMGKIDFAMLTTLPDCSASRNSMSRIEGTAEIVRDKAAFADHWNADLQRWFPQGIDTEGMAMLHVYADRIHYWDGCEEGEI